MSSVFTAKHICLASGTLLLSAWSYLTLKIYFERRRYKHIPGPPTEGYSLLTFMCSLLYFLISSWFLNYLNEPKIILFYWN
jgi:hypothetical protein